MPSREVRIASAVGLHARPASLFVKEAAGPGVPVTIQKEGKPPVNARRIRWHRRDPAVP